PRLCDEYRRIIDGAPNARDGLHHNLLRFLTAQNPSPHMPSLDTKKATQALRLKAEHASWGYIRIGKEIGWHKDQVRRAIEHAERKSPKPSTSILRYDAARQAVAEAKSFDEVREWENKAAAVKEYARRANDRGMELDAIEIQQRARRRRGELIVALKDMGILVDGRPKTVDGQRRFPAGRVTLEDLHTSKDESA